MFRAQPVRVRVPASAANLGPGFDAFGLALGLYDEVVVQVTDTDRLSVEVAGEGADDVRTDERNLVVRSMRRAFKELGGQPRGLALVCANRIPHGRGLGSSSAAIVAGLVAARWLAVGGDERLPDTALLALATAIEGHADNVAAALYGGFTIAWQGQTGVRAVRLPVHPAVTPVALVPATRLATSKARRLLPTEVTHADAAFTAGRAGLLVHALSVEPGLLMDATEDRLHQAQRAPAMPRSATVLERLRGAGVPAVVSGAGPTVLAMPPTGGVSLDGFLPKGWLRLDLPVADGVTAEAYRG